MVIGLLLYNLKLLYNNNSVLSLYFQPSYNGNKIVGNLNNKNDKIEGDNYEFT